MTFMGNQPQNSMAGFWLLGFCFLIFRIRESEVFGSEASVLRYSGQHRMAKFFIVVKSKHVTAADGMTQFYMRTFLRNNHPTFANQRSKDNSRFRTASFAQAGTWSTLIESGMSFDRSTSSAIA